MARAPQERPSITAATAARAKRVGWAAQDAYEKREAQKRADMMKHMEDQRAARRRGDYKTAAQRAEASRAKNKRKERGVDAGTMGGSRVNYR